MYQTKRRLPRASIGALILFAGLLIIAILTAPRVVEFRPSNAQPHIPANAPIQLRFNTPMDKNSVEARLTIQPGIQGNGSWDGNTLNFQPLSAWPQGETVKVGLEAGARSIVFLPILSSQDWSFTVDNPNLVFLSGAGVVPNLQIYDFDNGEIYPLTQSENGVLDYSLSWDRAKVVYDQQVEGKATEIRSKDIISGEDTVLFSCPQEHSCRNATLSPGEDFLAFVQYPQQENQGGDLVLGRGQVWILPLTTDEGAFRLSDIGHESVSPIWSSKNLLAFYDATSMSIEILKLDSEGEFDLLYSIPNELELLGSWSPDGRYLVFTEVEFPEPGPLLATEADSELSPFYSHIYRLDTLTGDVIDLTSPKLGLVEDASPLYSPDGQMIAFSRKFLDDERWDLGRQLWLMDPNGQDQRALSDASIYAHTNFAWDPTATTIASMRVNQSDPTEPVEIWVFEVSTGEGQMALEAGYIPHWVP